jgi:hypothetical protein
MKKKPETTEDLSAYMVPSSTEQPTPKFTVRGEHNVWHVYRNDERLEPPFRNEQRANTEREHYERSHAIRNERK